MMTCEDSPFYRGGIEPRPHMSAAAAAFFGSDVLTF
jgi:hypothetical protein